MRTPLGRLRRGAKPGKEAVIGDLERRVTVLEGGQAVAQKEAMEKEVLQLRGEVATMVRVRDEAMAEAARARDAAQEAGREAESLAEGLKARDQKIVDLEAHAAGLRGAIEDLAKERDAAAARLGLAEAEAESQAENVATLMKTLDAQAQLRARVQDEGDKAAHAAAEWELRATKAEEDLAKFRALLEAKTGEVLEANLSANKAAEMVRAFEDSLAEEQNTRQALEADLKVAQADRAAALARAALLEANLYAALEAKTDLLAEIQTKAEEVEVLRARLQKMESQRVGSVFGAEVGG